MQVSKTSLISAFSNGKIPTGSDFENLIDSCYTNNSIVSTLSTVSAYSDLTITQSLSAKTSNVTSLTAASISVDNLIFANITTGETSGIDASVVVSLQPSGSAILYFEKGILVELDVLTS